MTLLLSLTLIPAMLAGCKEKATDTGAGPVQELSGSWRAVAAGADFGCAIRDDDGAPVCWGADDDGVVSDVPEGLTGQLDITAGEGHACSRGADGIVHCWGANDFGQSDAVAAAALAVSAGARHACSVTASDLVNCWGDDSEGAIYPPNNRFQVIASGENFSCGVSEATGLACWGDEDPTTGAPRPGGPVASAPGTAFEVLAGGYGMACGIDTDSGSASCWGDTSAVGDAFDSGEWQALSLGQGEQCGLGVDGTVSCVQLRALGGSLDGAFQAVAGGGVHGCALSTSGVLSCWAVGDDTAGASAGPT